MDYVDNGMQQEAVKPNPYPEVQTLYTPINLLIFALCLYIFYISVRPRTPTTFPTPPPPKVFRIFTPPTLLPYNGSNNPSVYLSVLGNVYDVTPGRNFYGPGGPYENFAGRDASRGLAKGSFDSDMLTTDLEGSLDKLEGLEEDEWEALRGWEERFREKYLCVGRLVAVGVEGSTGDGNGEPN